MRAEDILDALPVKFFVIDLKTKKVIQTNDPIVNLGEKPCYLQLFDKQASCREGIESCFCDQENNTEFQFFADSGERNEKCYYKVDVKKSGDNLAVVTYSDITPEMRASKEVKINNSRLQRAENLASFGSWEFDLRTNTMLGTKGACEIYGITKPVLSIDEVKKIPLPEYREALDKEMDNLISGKGNYNIRFRIKRPNDGEIRYIHSIAEYREDKQMIFGVIHDITEMVYFESALHESNTDLRLAQNIARIGNWKFDPANKNLQVSDQVLQILGKSEIPAYASFSDFENYSEKTHFAQFKRSVWRAIKVGEPFEQQFCLKMQDETEKWVEFICQPDPEPGPAGYYLRGTLQDITSNKMVEIELQNSNNLFQTLIQNLPDAIYMKDSDGRKVIANDGDVRNCGVEGADQIIGKTDFEIYPKEVAEQYFEDDRHVLEQGKAVINREEELPGESKRWILTSKFPLKNSDGRITGLVGIGHDITHRKKMMEELKTSKLKAEESDRLKSLFLANMSHEIRTPLNGILGFSSFICSGNINSGQLGYYGKIIENCGQRLTNVIGDILDISLIQSNQLKMDYSEFNLFELLEEIFLFYKTRNQSQLEKIDFRLRTEFTNCKHIYSDKNRLYQVLKNLLENAFKFTEEGYIEFGCLDSANNELILFVKDSGIGIEEDKKAVIFESFRQAEEGLSRQYEGTGLGLAIVAGIVERLGGKVWVNSKPGQGSAFYVSVPLHAKTVFTKPEQTESSLNGKDMKADQKLIVSFEDDPTSAEYMKSVVTLLGCRYVNFDQPRMGIEYLRNNKADLILMDVRLPEMNGFEVTRIIKSEFPNLPVIIQTAYAMKEDMEKAFQAGCDDYLAKPLSINDLRSKIKHFIGSNNN